MPLHDHFRPPLGTRRHWHAFHNSWATYISSHLNEQLPPGYFAEANVQFNIEIDVAAFEETPAAGASASWNPPAPSLTLPLAALTDIVEILLYQTSGGPILAGAVELVSPANKDRQAHRDAFVNKCAALVQQGVGLAMVDVVTERQANLHLELLRRLSGPLASVVVSDLYATAYRPTSRDGQLLLEVWQEELELGRPLPAVPLWLRGGLTLRLDLEATYERTCREQRLLVNGASSAAP